MTVLWLSILLPGYPPPGILVMPVLWLPVFSSWLSSAKHSCHDCPLAACLFFLAFIRQDFLS